MRIAHNNSTDHETAIADVSALQCGPEGHLVIVAATPAVLWLARVARATRQASIARDDPSLPSRGKSERGT